MQTLEKISNRCWYQTPVSDTNRPILGVVIFENVNACYCCNNGMGGLYRCQNI